MQIDETEMAEGSDSAPPFTFLVALRALVVAGLWISVLCALPQQFGGAIWRSFGIDSAGLPLSHTFTVFLNLCAVVAFLLITGRRSLLVPTRPPRPWWILALVPLVALNCTRGPFTDRGTSYVLVVLLSTSCTGLWEECLFRGLIQERLKVMGWRAAYLLSAAMFGLIHSYAGWWKVYIAFVIGLTFSQLRDRLGLWPLVIAHFLIDFLSDLFDLTWHGYGFWSNALIMAYCVVNILALFRRRG